MIRSPKERFCKSTHAKQFVDLTLSPIFEEACDVAMAQFVYSAGLASSGEHAAAKQFNLEGAMRFMHILQQIGKPEEMPEHEPIGVLRPVN